MAQFSFVKSHGGILVPATPDAQEWITTKVKLGDVISGEFKRVRNGVMHRRFFSLLNLSFEYWEPAGGTISPNERLFLQGFVDYIFDAAGEFTIFSEMVDEYINKVSTSRKHIQIVKSFDAFRRWVTIEAGYFSLLCMPDGSLIKEPKSISFAKMDDIEFNELYKSAFNVLWQFILSRHFSSQHEAEQTALELLQYSMQGAV